MQTKYFRLFFSVIIVGILLTSLPAVAQTGTISGIVKSDGFGLPTAAVSVQKTSLGNKTDDAGKYNIQNVPAGTYRISASAIGFVTAEKTMVLKAGQNVILNFELAASISALDQVVVTGTRTPKRQTNSPVICKPHQQ